MDGSGNWKLNSFGSVERSSRVEEIMTLTEQVLHVPWAIWLKLGRVEPGWIFQHCYESEITVCFQILTRLPFKLNHWFVLLILYTRKLEHRCRRWLQLLPWSVLVEVISSSLLCLREMHWISIILLRRRLVKWLFILFYNY